MVTLKEIRLKSLELQAEKLRLKALPGNSKHNVARLIAIEAKLELIAWMDQQENAKKARETMQEQFDLQDFSLKQELGINYPNPEKIVPMIRAKNQISAALAVFDFFLDIETIHSLKNKQQR